VAQFRYRLQTLLDQKAQAKEEAQHALAAAQQELRIQEEELQACRREQEASADRVRRAREEIVSPASVHGSNGELMRMRRDYIGRLQDEWCNASDATAAQELAVREAEERLTAARETLTTASREVEVLEKHRARLERRFHDEVGRKETLEQEEMANVMFMQRRNEA
jgi:flagellar biosynthesis chaperone FliJ